MIEIDGSEGEGGGAMLRLALALSTVTGKPFRMTNIRARRPTPGLKHEHLHCIRILQKISDAKAEDVHLGSESILFIPGAVKNARLDYDLETAASTTLVAQCLVLATLFSGKKVTLTLRGGTDVKWSPSADYLQQVFLPALRPLGDIGVKVLRRGYYPAGGGILEVAVKGNYLVTNPDLPAFDLESRGELHVVGGTVHAARSLEQAQVCERAQERASLLLAARTAAQPIAQQYVDASCAGAGITLWAKCDRSVIGSDALGERGVTSERLAETAVHALKETLATNAAVDPYLADQLLAYLAICGGTLKTSVITEHLRSNILVARRFLSTRFDIDDFQARVTCEKDDEDV